MTVIYVDTLFLLNTMVDYLLLLASARLAGEPLARLRIAQGEVLGGLYAVADILPRVGVQARPKCGGAGAVRMVDQAAQAGKSPVIGMGGIMTADDAREFILAGATAVAVGTANFVNPCTTAEIVDGIEAYMKKYGVEDINELIGAVR